MLTLALAATLACSVVPNDSVRDVDYAKLFAEGETFEQFLGKAERRKELWHSNYARAVVPDALQARTARVTGTWNVLVVAIDSCSDSASTIPYLARLLERMPNVTLRIVNPTAGKAIMEAHRTPDGRAATPTVILLDSAFVERGCWIERPQVLQAMIAGENKSDKDAAVFEGKMQWYAKDQGQSTMAEFVDILESAAQGEGACARG